MPGRSRFSMAQGFCTVCDVTGRGLFQKLQLHIPLSSFSCIITGNLLFPSLEVDCCQAILVKRRILFFFPV